MLLRRRSEKIDALKNVPLFGALTSANWTSSPRKRTRWRWRPVGSWHIRAVWDASSS